jgi:predicted transcriptional regulator
MHFKGICEKYEKYRDRKNEAEVLKEIADNVIYDFYSNTVKSQELRRKIPYRRSQQDGLRKCRRQEGC